MNKAQDVTGKQVLAAAGILGTTLTLMFTFSTAVGTTSAYSAAASTVFATPGTVAAQPAFLTTAALPVSQKIRLQRPHAYSEVVSGAQPVPEQHSKVATAWAAAAAFFALAAVTVHRISGQQQPSLTEFSEMRVDLNSVAMATTTGEKKSTRLHDFALVVNNKGGGHGEIGLHLALALKAKGLAVQVINDTGGKDISSKVPFSEYGQLTAAGIEVAYVDLSQPGALQTATCPPEHLCRAYDYIFDNENVCQKEVADLAASCDAYYIYVSSGGMYIPGDKFPMKESNPSKGADANAQRKHELYVMSDAVRPQLRGCAFFRPQYIVGPYTNKRDYLDWFFDRLTRNLPVLLPAPGTQTTTVTDVRDVANMIASVVGKWDAIAEAEKACAEVGPVFNCASDRPVSLRQVVMSCGTACGKSEAETAALIKLYDPKVAKGAPSGGKFPFRDTNFDVGVDKAKVVLGWESEYNDFDDIALGYWEGYKALGLHLNNPKMDTSWDEYVLSKM